MKNKNKFNTHWKTSKKPGKQRKYREKTPLHLRRKFLSSRLDKELRKKYNIRNIPLRKGDTVMIMKGKFKKKKGKVTGINTKRMHVEVEGIQMKKQDGSKTNVLLRPSNLMITELNIEDKKRREGLKEIKNTEEKEQKKELGSTKENKETKKNASKTTKST